MVGVPEERVGEAGLQEVHREEGGDLDNLVEENVHGLPVPDVLSGPLLAKPQQRGRCKSQELFQPVFNVVVASNGEEAAQ